MQISMMATLRVSIEDVEELKTSTCSEAHQESIHVRLDLKARHKLSSDNFLHFKTYRFEITALRFDEVTDYKTNKSNNDTHFLVN